MKLICDCGNEEEFKTHDDFGIEYSVTDEGQYSTINDFDFWETHDEVGIVCRKCGKAIWLFT